MSEDIMRYSLLAYVLSMRNLSAVRRYYALQPTGLYVLSMRNLSAVRRYYVLQPTGLCAQYKESECGKKMLCDTAYWPMCSV